MELSFSDLRKREVINMVDGRSLGRVCDLSLDFPEGVLTGIFVPGRRSRGLFHIFDKTKIFIPENNIVKIGGDVILVDLKCGEVCAPNSKRRQPPPNLQCPPKGPPCPPKTPPCPPKGPHGPQGHNKNFSNDLEIFSGLDGEDY